MTEVFDWLKPSLLWGTDGLAFRLPDFFRPQLLEFQSDAFMDDFLAAAARPTSAALAVRIAQPPTPEEALKFYQPTHGNFYLICCSLCCRVPSFPDRVVSTDDGETTFFVIRKLVDGAEYGWVPAGERKGWRPLNGGARALLPDEERLPLLTTTSGTGRDLYFGYLPVASRETYAVAPAEIAVAGVPGVDDDSRIEELKALFSDQVSVVDNSVVPAPLEVSVFILLDLWEYLNTNLPDVAAALRDDPGATFSGDGAAAKTALVAFLQTQQLGGTLTLAAALGAVARQRDALNVTGGPDLGALGFGGDYSLKGRDLDHASLWQDVKAALPEAQPSTQLPQFDPSAGALYVVRCVYERPQCETPVRAVSLPSAPFRLAPFFDPDAPVRPVRIPLPSDVSIAGLRKFKKGVSFMLSDAMRQKMKNLSGQEPDLLKDPPSFNDPADGLGIAFICSFSIQIIFIVAFFLLLMFVFILNIVFWWIAFFRICLPIPKRLLPE
jgi:hypothetical protein